mgnify:CR=1 FL=1
MKRTKRVLGLALAAVMCMGMLAGCGGTKNAIAMPLILQAEQKRVKRS